MLNKVQKQKGALLAFAIIVLIIGVCAACGGLALILGGIGSIVEGNLVWPIIKIILGALLIILGGVGIVYGVIMLFTGIALKATKETIVEDNLAVNPNLEAKIAAQEKALSNQDEKAAEKEAEKTNNE